MGGERKPIGRRLLGIGIAGLVLGTGPLLFAVVWSHAHGDPNPNPVGPGMCAMCTFWPSVGLVLAGFVALSKERRGRRDGEPPPSG